MLSKDEFNAIVITLRLTRAVNFKSLEDQRKEIGRILANCFVINDPEFNKARFLRHANIPPE